MKTNIEIIIAEPVLEFIRTLRKEQIQDIYIAFHVLKKFPEMYPKLEKFEGRVISFSYFCFYYVYREHLGKIVISDYKFYKENSFHNLHNFL